MSELRVHNFSISLDGYGAGPRRSEQDPLGVGGEQLHEWIFDDAATEVDPRFRARGEGPPFHHDVFVLTHHPREPVPMAGGTTFHFVTEGIEAALGPALDAWHCAEFAPSASVTHVRLRR